jgi:outer membrane receptor protein involved in Fe transport
MGLQMQLRCNYTHPSGRALSAACFFFSVPALLSAAECVAGTVAVKRTGEPLSFATASITAGDRSAIVRADENGRFGVRDVSGVVALSVRAPGFQTEMIENVKADCAAPPQLRIELEIAPVAETVTVEERAAVVRTDAPEISQTISTRQVQELPSNGRNWTRLALLDPHVRNTAGLGSDGSSGARLSINASSFRHTSHSLDGNSNYDAVFANAPQQSVSLSAVREVKVLTNQYSAEFGGTSSGILVTATKTGTDQLHGELFGYLRPSGPQAAPPVSPYRVPNQRWQAGAAAGGPIRTGRTHVFGTYEKIGQERGSYISSPKPDMFVGRFDEYYALARLDQRWNDRHSSSFRLNGNHGENNNMNDRIGGFTQPSAAQRNLSQAVGAQAAHTSLIGNLYNEVRASYSNYIPSASGALFPQVAINRPNYAVEGGSSSSWVRAQNVQISDTLALAAAGHNVRIGGDYVRLFVKDFSYTPFGEYRFAAGAPTPGQKPQTYIQTFGAALLRYGQSIATAFVQDDWRVRSRLTLNLGLRYERQSLTTDRTNFAPRVGLAWDVTGTGSTTVRAGAGLFYDHYYLYITRRFYLQGVSSPTSTYSIPFGTPGFPEFPNSLTEPPVGVSAGKRDIYLPADKLRNPYALQYSLGIQQRVGEWVFAVDGMHQHTLRQMRANDINHPLPFIRTQAGQRRSGAAADATRPFQTWQGVPVRNITVVENSGSSLYDALDFGVIRRMARRYQFEAHYVYSSSATYAMFFGEPNTGIPSEWNDTGRGERGPSDFHQRHRLVANGLVDLPWKSQLSLVTTVASGLPVNPLTGVDNNGDTYSFDRPPGLGRNSYRAPSQSGVDVSFAKRWTSPRERFGLEFRAEAFNVFNHHNVIKVNSVWGDAAQPAATFLAPIPGVANIDPARQFQAALRLIF